MYIAENEAILRNVLAAYDFPDTPIGVVRYGSSQVTYVEPCSAAYAVSVSFRSSPSRSLWSCPAGKAPWGFPKFIFWASKPLTRANRLRE